jgi:hypothetical protein
VPLVVSVVERVQLQAVLPGSAEVCKPVEVVFEVEKNPVA